MNGENFERKFIELYQKKNLWQWKNYRLDQNNDLNIVNKEIHQLLRESGGNIKFSGRKQDVYQQIYVKNMVENNPKVAALRNKLDNPNNYKSDSSENLDSIKLAKRMRNDVLKLMEVRNNVAQKLGFESYPGLIFYSEELKKSEVVNGIRNYLDNNLDKAIKVIKKYQFNWDNWFTQLRKIGQLSLDRQIGDDLQKFFDKLGLGNLRDNITFDFENNKLTGFAMWLSIPDDIRVLMKPIDSLHSYRILFHEAGHAILYASNREDGLFKIVTTAFDEIMAVLFEGIGIELFLNQEDRQLVEEIKLLEGVRCSISFLFEMELWKNPGQPEQLFNRYQQLLPIKPKESILWAVDSFRSIDPVYIHNYILGEIYAQKIINQLIRENGSDHQRWGSIIGEKFLVNGQKESFREKYQNFKI